MILNRTPKQAEELATTLKQKFKKKIKAGTFSPESIKDNLADADVLINATSIGMAPNTNQTPIQSQWLKPNLVVMDIVYNPLETKLAKEAKAAGAKVISGVEMLIYQGAASFEIWTACNAPIDVMRQAALTHLGKV